MQVKEAMTSGIESVKASDSLKLAAKAMAEYDIGDVFVYEDTDKIVGILTDRDIVTRALAEGASPDTEAKKFMTSKLVSCYEDEDLSQAAKTMEKEQLRRLLVRNRKEEPIGVLAQADVARALGRSKLTGEVVEKVSQPGGKHSQKH